MFPFDQHGGILHLSPTAAERVAFLVVDTGPLGEPVEGGSRDTRMFPVSRARLLDDGWIRAVAERRIGTDQVVADVLFAPGEVIAVHNEWAASDGPGGSQASESAEQRRQSWEQSWR
jgi:hypothetical protein